MTSETETTNKKTVRRKPSDAAALSAVLPGLGHLYLGRFRQGILWIGAAVTLMTLAIIALLASPTSGGLSLALTFIGIGIALTLVCIVKAWRLAKRHRDGYQLREYNRWYVYAILILACGISSAIALSFIVGERVVQAFVIPTQSMLPTIDPGDRILALKQVYLDRDPERGELVVFRNPDNRRQFWIKRVVAIGGDRIEWQHDGEFLVNGKVLPRTPTGADDEFTEQSGSREYAIRLAKNNNGTPPASSGSLTIAPNHCFVLGDNRYNSKDSRHFGPVSYASLIGSPVAKIWGGFGKLR